MDYFETKEEAEKNLPEPKPLGFCPAINGKCRTDCICYNKAWIYEPKQFDTTKISIRGPYCSHALISQDISILNWPY